MSEHKEFYDNLDVRAKYIARRTQPDNPNDTLERPIFFKLVGNLNQLDIIDLGCGDHCLGKKPSYKGHALTLALKLLEQSLTLF
jgi:hypothetical protein